MAFFISCPIFSDQAFASVEEKFMAIAMNMPAVQTFYKSSKPETLSMFQKVMKLVGSSEQPSTSNMNSTEFVNIVKHWCATSFLPAVKGTTLVLLSSNDQKLLLAAAHSSGWILHIQAIFKILKMPVIESYAVLESVWDLDTLLYKYLHPFPRELEKSTEEMAKLEANARKPVATK